MILVHAEGRFSAMHLLRPRYFMSEYVAAVLLFFWNM